MTRAGEPTQEIGEWPVRKEEVQENVGSWKHTKRKTLLRRRKQSVLSYVVERSNMRIERFLFLCDKSVTQVLARGWM